MMERILRQITEHFVARLPDGASYYRIESLKKQDFPDFLVQRIHIELQWNLDESMILPETDWANTKSEAVQRSWQQFLKVIHAEAQLPASYAKAVIETAVADIVEMLVEPRKKITDILFGGEKVLKAAELNERSKLLVVYPHFAKVLTGYMQRKTRDEMSRSRCKKIVAQVDDKVTRQYTPLQWAQMLDPLFTLGDNSVNTNLLCLFFEDRQMHRTAGKFDDMDETITQAGFVEALSEPELWDHQDYQKDQPENSDEEKPIDLEKHANLDDIGLVYENIGEIHKYRPSSEKPVSKEKRDRKSEREQKVNRRDEKSGQVNLEADPDMDEADDYKPESSEQPEPEEFQSVIKDKEEDEIPVPKENKPVVKNQDQEDYKEPETKPEREKYQPAAKNRDEEDYKEPELDSEPEPENEQSEQPYSLNAFFAESEDNIETEDQSGMLYSPFAPEDETEKANIADEEENAAQPIWMRYRNEDDTDKESDEEIMPRFVEIEDEQGRWSESLADKSSEEDAPDSDYQLKELKECLKKERGYFIDEVFNGSEQAYKESLEKIAKENSWKDVSKLIEQDIFRRNNVNIFSAAAVNFIDRLQDFFLEKYNRN